VSNVTTSGRMTGVFNGATVFNRDIQTWCVSSYSSKPSNFSTSSALTQNNEPIWGQCP